MAINLSEEIIEIEKTLFGIKEEYESCLGSLFSQTKKDIFQADKFTKVRFYDYYPYLFHNEFERVSKETFRTIAISGALYLRYLLLNDRMMDSKDIINPSNLLYSDYLHEKSLSLLHSLFSSSSVFWEYFAGYNREFTSAILLERTKHFGIVSPYSFSEFESIAKGKSTMAKYVTTALAILNETPEKIEALEKSQDYFHIGFQLIDDLQDWKEDYLNRNYSCLLTSIIYQNKLVEHAASNNPPDLETIGRALYLSKMAEKQMNYAVRSLKKATAYGAICPLWIDIIKEYLLQSEELRNKYDSIFKKLISRRKIQHEQSEEVSQKNKSSIKNKQLLSSIKHALDYILTDRELNLLAMEHRMSSQSGKNKSTYVVFLRALIIDTLLDARSFYPNADEIIEKEVEILVASKLKKIRGGWRYFPELDELPPDADDLGQVLQVLSKSRYDAIDEAVSDPVSLLLSQCSYDDGSFETWLVDYNDPSNETAIIKNAFNREWTFRKGKDNDVLANILYGLYLYDFNHLKDRIKKGINCLEKRQSKEGYWSSNWYWGNYYGTYVSARIINAVTPGSSTLKNAAEYLMNSQNYDGGWGNIGSDPLNTAFALLTLVLLRTKNRSCITNGLNYLYSRQNPKGFWEKVEFIKASDHDSTHKSKIITTQYCLKALVAISKEINLKNLTLVSKQRSLLKPRTQVHTLYKDFSKYVSVSNSSNKEDKHQLLNSFYIEPNKDFFEYIFKISSVKPYKITDRLLSYIKADVLSLITQIKQDNVTDICKKSINHCFELLPMNKMPDIYLWIGPYAFPGESSIIDSKPAIIISLEYFTDFHSLQFSKDQEYYKTRMHEMKKSIPIIIANRYARLILKQMGVVKESFFAKLFETGFATYFSREIFPHISLSSHLFISEAELEWCRRNEWYLKRELKPYLQSANKKIIGKYFSIKIGTNNRWLPNMAGSFTGYRIIEEHLKKVHTLTIRDLITESQANLVTKSSFFNL